MDRYGWLAVAGVGWALVVGVATAIYARWTFVRRGWTAPLQTRALDRMQRTQSSFEAISQVPVRTPEVTTRPEPVREPERRLVPLAALFDDPIPADESVTSEEPPVRTPEPVMAEVAAARAPEQVVMVAAAPAPMRLAVEPPAPRIEAPAPVPAPRVEPPAPAPKVKAPAQKPPPKPVAAANGTARRPARRPSTLALLQRLSDPDPMRRTAALWEATSLPDADRIMVRALSDEFPMVRREAVRVLGQLGSDAATKALTEVSGHDTSSEVREEAIAQLGEVIRRRKGAAFEETTG